MVHASDNRGVYDDHLPPGEGNVPWMSLLRQLQAYHFGGAFILEVASGQDPHRVLEGARRARAYLRCLSRALPGPYDFTN